MEQRGISREVAERIVKQLTAFANYGFPESHAASFALLVYASTWMKAHHAPEFYCAILNAQPMGFYPIGTLVADARRHGVRIRGADVTLSDWDSTLEGPELALRLGVRLVRGLGPRAQAAFERARATPGALASIESFARATELPVASLVALARAGAFDSLAADRRRALWEVLRVGRAPAGPLDRRGDDPLPVELAPVEPAEATMEDYALLGASPELHPMQHLRDRLQRAGIPTIAELATRPPGPIRIAGLVNSRQRPMTAKGFVFLSLEDETGMCNIIVSPRLFEREHAVIAHAPVLLVIGELEKRHGTINVKARTCRPIRDVPGARGAKSHDFH
jgi:error-prone DNA polymerase